MNNKLLSIDVYMKGQLNFLLIWEYKRFWGFNICLSRGCSDRKIFLDVSNSGSILVKIYVFLRLSLAKTMSRSNLANTVVTSCFLCSHFFVETVFEVYIWYDRWIIVFWFFFFWIIMFYDFSLQVIFFLKYCNMDFDICSRFINLFHMRLSRQWKHKLSYYINQQPL